MVKFFKTSDGVLWNDIERKFTNSELLGYYEIIDDIHILIELNHNVYSFKCDETLIDNNGPFISTYEIVANLFT